MGTRLEVGENRQEISLSLCVSWAASGCPESLGLCGKGNMLGIQYHWITILVMFLNAVCKYTLAVQQGSARALLYILLCLPVCMLASERFHQIVLEGSNG